MAANSRRWNSRAKSAADSNAATSENATGLTSKPPITDRSASLENRSAMTRCLLVLALDYRNQVIGIQQPIQPSIKPIAVPAGFLACDEGTGLLNVPEKFAPFVEVLADQIIL